MPRQTLRDLRGPQPLVDVLGIGADLARQLAEAHREGRVHGELSACWVGLGPDGARLSFPDPTPQVPLTGPGPRHDPAGISPEQVRDYHDGTAPPADVYSLGALLYALASGRWPLPDGVENLLDAVRAKLEDDLVPLRERDVDLPPWFTTFVEDMLALDPDRRPTAAEVLRRLSREHATALLARKRPQRRTPAPALPRPVVALYEVLRPVGPVGLSGESWEFLARARGGGDLVTLRVSSNDGLAVAEPFVEGETLAGRLERLGALPADEVAALGRGVALRLATLHPEGPHGCLTPAQVRFDFEGRVHLDPAPRPRHHPATDVDVLDLSPEHLSPEPARTVTRASDLYGLGLLLYRAATGGELPYPGADRLARLRDKRDGRRVRLRARARIPRRLARLIDRLLARDPARRPELGPACAVLARC